MDLATLQARARAARTVSHSIGEITYTLLVPEQHDILVAAQRTGALKADGDAAGMLLLNRAVLLDAVIGWTGVRVGHILPDDPEAAAPLAWEPGAVPLLLGARPADAAALTEVLNDRTAARKAAIEADSGN